MNAMPFKYPRNVSCDFFVGLCFHSKELSLPGVLAIIIVILVHQVGLIFWPILDKSLPLH